MKDTTNHNTTEATWTAVWEAATAATSQTVAAATDWASENPIPAAGAAAVVGVGIGYLLFG